MWLIRDYMVDKRLEELWAVVKKNPAPKQVADVYAEARNTWPVVEDEVYDYEEGTDEWKTACKRDDE